MKNLSISTTFFSPLGGDAAGRGGLKKHLLLTVITLGLFLYAHAQTGIIQLPATGQTTSYYPGDDGDLQKGIPIPANRFTDHGNGSATDQLTGLMWATDANLIASRDPDFDQDRVVGDGDIDWRTALNYIQKLNDENYLGHNDWRMPNCMELRSLVNLGNDSITFPENHPFTNLKEGYWSSTTYDRLRVSAISVYLSKLYVHVNLTYHVGTFGGAGKNLGTVITYLRLYLLPVRDGGANGNIEIPQSGQTVSYYAGDDVATGAGIPWPSPRLVDNKDGSVSDRLTGLMWTKDMLLMFNRDPGYFEEHGSSWTTALDYIAKLNNENYLGFNDWRLPNYNELVSLIDYSRHRPDLPKFHPFTTTWPYEIYPLLGYWSSTSVAADSGKAWYYHFVVSNLYSNEKSINNFVWPVRTDNNSLPSGAIHGFIDGEDIPLKGFEITLEGPVNARTETDVDGYYEFTNITDGNYTVTPSCEYFAFTPVSKSVDVNGTAESCDFIATYTRAYGWTDISSHLFQFDGVPGSGLHDLYFISDDEGWITSTNGGIYHTTDGGETFEKQTLTLGGYATAIFMLDSLNGYSGSAGGWVYKTDDGGLNWNILATMGNLYDISFPPGTDPNNPIGYASGDDGRVWEITSTLTDLNTGLAGDFNGISAPSVNNVWACGGNRIYYYDGTGFTSQIAPGGTFSDIHFINNQEGWVVGDGGIIGRTSNGGAAWITQTNPDTQDRSLYGVFFLDSNNGWAVGIGGIILHTIDAGTIWTIEVAGLTTAFLIRAQFTSLTNGYVSGNNGTLLKYTKLPGAPEGADILGIKLPGQVGEAVVNKQQRTVTAEVLNTIDITKLVPEIFPSAGATVDPPSGTRQDFTKPVVYKVTASDGSFKNWIVSVDVVDGVEEDMDGAAEDCFRIYPNPASEEFQVAGYRLQVGGATIEIYDLNGRKLLEKTIPKGSEEITVDVRSLHSGLYFVRLTVGNKSVTKKLIIK
ncbi:MAG: hypothetical protein DRI87_04220 [Bacteroidetes bacterium]|nr:MAG: hypothetical protein DRI87_04220 [Bacteroidota bacterium]